MTEPEKPGVIDRLRARYRWFDHVMRAQDRYTDCKGDFFAAGITYFTVFALFPLAMVGFSIGGFVLAGRPDLIAHIHEQISSNVPGEFGQQLIQLMESAINARTSVGLIGLAGAAWAGLAWMNNLREALSEMWGERRREKAGFVHTKLSDTAALLSTFLALVVTLGLTALGDRGLMRRILEWFQIPDMPGLGLGLKAASVAVSILVSWLLFTWIIARLPRESISFRSSLRAGLMVAVGFEVFKQVGSVYLQSVTTSPAGVAFGPVLGLMVFAYVTARLLLFATSWAATATDNLHAAPVEPPGPAQITPRVQVRESAGFPAAVAAAAAGVLGAVAISRLFRRQ